MPGFVCLAYCGITIVYGGPMSMAFVGNPGCSRIYVPTNV